jgi:hypothetical protein
MGTSTQRCGGSPFDQLNTKDGGFEIPSEHWCLILPRHVQYHLLMVFLALTRWSGFVGGIHSWHCVLHKASRWHELMASDPTLLQKYEFFYICNMNTPLTTFGIIMRQGYRLGRMETTTSSSTKVLAMSTL